VPKDALAEDFGEHINRVSAADLPNEEQACDGGAVDRGDQKLLWE
jgi:hypothetical protein